MFQGMEYVYEVYKEKSFSRAAANLFISQPSLSANVRRVENRIGYPIFDRSTDPITLTPAGQLYIQAAQRIHEISGTLRHQVQALSQEQTGTLRLGISIQRAIQIMPKLYPLFSQQYPHVQLQLREQGSVSLENALLENQVDIACLSTIPKNIHLEYNLIQEESFVLLATPACDLARRIPDGTPIDIAEAKNERFISCKPGHGIQRVQQIMFRTRGMAPAIAFETDSIEVGKATLSSAPLVMMCPNVYASANSPHRYCVYPLLSVDSPRHFYACYRKDIFLTQYMKGFLKILQEVVVE